MGKNVYLPGLALIGGVLGLGLRLWQRLVNFDPETLLFPAGGPAPVLLLALTAAVAAILLLALRKPIEKADGPAEETGEVGA